MNEKKCPYIVEMKDSFMKYNHMFIVFELLHISLYD